MKSDREVADMISKKILDRSKLTIEKIESAEQRIKNPFQNPQHQSHRNTDESEYALDLTHEQIQRLMNFDTEINDLILRVRIFPKISHFDQY
jgi:energy-coupling factor transporter ATP-binding protein EcfA2